MPPITPALLATLSRYPRWPRTAAEIVRVIGRDASVPLFEKFRGQEIPVPMVIGGGNPAGEIRYAALAEIVGEHAADKIVRHWGGQNLYVPTLKQVMSDWIADRLLPWAASRWPIGSDPRERVVAGQSLGGVTALLTAAERPDAVGAFVSQSASLWQPGVVQRVSRLPAGVRGYLEVGTQEWVLLEPNRALHQALLAAGVPHDYVEYNGGHDYACWRGGIADGLRSVLGAAMP